MFQRGLKEFLLGTNRKETEEKILLQNVVEKRMKSLSGTDVDFNVRTNGYIIKRATSNAGVAAVALSTGVGRSMQWRG